LMIMRRERKILFNVLKNRNFFALWIGQIISQFGDRLAQMGLVGIYLTRTENISLAESIPLMRNLFFFSTLPLLIFTPFAGICVDRWSRRNILITSDFLRAILVLLIPVCVAYTQNIGYVYFIIFLIFSVTCFFNPAKLAFIPNLVGKDQLLAANSLSNITRMVAMIGGVVAGGIIVARLGITFSFVLDSISFAVSGCAVALVQIKGRPREKRENINTLRKVKKDLKEGIEFIVRNKEVLLLSFNLLVSMAATGLAYVLVTAFVTKGLGLGTEGLGIVACCLGIGMILGSLFYGQFGEKVKRNLAVILGILAAGLCALILAKSNSILSVSLGVFLIGLIGAVIMIAANTFIQEFTPDSFRGRVFAALEIIINSSFLIFVWIAGVLGTRYSLSCIFYAIGGSLLVYSSCIILFKTKKREF